MLFEIILFWVLWTLKAPTWCWIVNIIATIISTISLLHKVYEAGQKC